VGRADQCGGIELPAEVAGVVALNEVIVHGWDIAVASGQHMSCDPHLAEEAFAFVQSTVAAHPHGSAACSVHRCRFPMRRP